MITDKIADENGDRMEVDEGSGNVFADLGLPDPEERLAKARISMRIGKIIEERGLTQSAAAAIMEVSQPDISNMIRGKLKNFSMDRLIGCLMSLDQDVEIVIRTKRGEQEHGKLTVSCA